MQFRQLIKIISILLIPLLIGGCTAGIWNRYPPPQVTDKNGAAVGAVSGAAIGGIAVGTVAGAGFGAVAGGILGASIANIIESHMTLVDKLQYNGVQVIQLGDEVELILPTDRFFKPNSPLMNSHYYSVLALVAKFIKQFPKVSIKVAGYTDNVGEWQRNLMLSKKRAQLIMQDLWDYGVDTRLIYAVGYGSKHPIANNKTAAGRSKNNRVVISLRQIRNRGDFG